MIAPDKAASVCVPVDEPLAIRYPATVPRHAPLAYSPATILVNRWTNLAGRPVSASCAITGRGPT